VLKRTSASLGLAIAAALFAPLTSPPAYAHANLLRGRHGSHQSHYAHHRNRNWNGNRHHGRIFIRIYVYNKNNNRAIALARPAESREERPVREDDGFFSPGGLLSGQGVARAHRRAAPAPAAAPRIEVRTGTAPQG
jgi:hypothetical protein